MKVIDLISKDFDEKAVFFKNKILSEFSPDVVIGIATGGAYLVSKMDFSGIPIMEVKKQRGLTKVKNKFFLKWLLSILPTSVNKLLRVIELMINEFIFNIRGVKRNDQGVDLIKGDFGILKDAKKILIIDDAIDSGSTFIECIDYIKPYLSDDCELKTAVINVTFKKPAFTPDYNLYERTIVRYPWANDVRK